MSWLLGLWATLVVLNYAVAPGHHAALDDLTGYFIPRHGSFAAVTLLDGWLSRGTAIAAWLLLNAAVLGAGAAGCRWLTLRPGTVRAWLVGLAPLALAILGLGLAGLLAKPVLGVVLLVSTLSVLGLRRSPGRPTIDTWLAIAPCLLALPAALAPEIVFDALRYHLALPDHYLRVHRVVLVDRFLFSSYPQGMEMLFAPALAFGTTVTAKLLAWQTFAMSGVLLHGFLTARLPRPQALALAMGFTAMPFLSVHAATAGVDLPVACLELAGFLLLAEAAEQVPTPRQAALAGWLLGTALGIKYLAAFAGGGAVLALLVVAPHSLRRIVRHGWPFAIAVPAVWGVKNWLLTGNPAYPYFFGHWQLEPETFRRHLLWAADWRATHPDWSAWATMIPVSLTRGVYDALGEALAPAMFFLPAVFALAARPLDRRTRFLAVLSAILWLAWNHAAGGIYRYLAPLYPAAFLALAALLPDLRGIPSRAIAAALWLGVAVEVPPLIAAQDRAAGAASVLLGCESEQAYLHGILPPPGRYLPAMARAAATAWPGSLLVLGDPKAFYAPGRCITEFECAPSILLRLAEDSTDAGRIRTGLRQRNIRAVLYRVEGMISMGAMSGALVHGAALDRYQEFRRTWLDPAWTIEVPAENVFYQCFVPREAPGTFRGATSGLRFTLPGLEALTTGMDQALEHRQGREALRLARDLVRREPGYVPGWLRVREAARMAGNPGDAGAAASAIRRLGYAALLTP